MKRSALASFCFLMLGGVLAYSQQVGSPANGSGAASDKCADLDACALACKLGDLAACSKTGDKYLGGRGVEADSKMAARWYEIACKSGDALACYRLSNLYGTSGSGIDSDKERSVRYLEKACSFGGSTYCADLGVVYGYGYGVPVDYEQALHYSSLACEDDIPSGCGYLGALYLWGHGVTQDKAKAIGYLENACNSRDMFSCRTLGDVYTLPKYGLQNDVKAIPYLELACRESEYENATCAAAQYSADDSPDRTKVREMCSDRQKRPMGDCARLQEVLARHPVPGIRLVNLDLVIPDVSGSVWKVAGELTDGARLDKVSHSNPDTKLSTKLMLQNSTCDEFMQRMQLVGANVVNGLPAYVLGTWHAAHSKRIAAGSVVETVCAPTPSGTALIASITHDSNLPDERLAEMGKLLSSLLTAINKEPRKQRLRLPDVNLTVALPKSDGIWKVTASTPAASSSSAVKRVDLAYRVIGQSEVELGIQVQENVSEQGCVAMRVSDAAPFDKYAKYAPAGWQVWTDPEGVHRACLVLRGRSILAFYINSLTPAQSQLVNDMLLAIQKAAEAAWVTSVSEVRSPAVPGIIQFRDEYGFRGRRTDALS